MSRYLSPASLAGLTSSKLKRDSISKDKVSETEVPKVLQDSPQHACISTHMSICTHIIRHTQTCTKQANKCYYQTGVYLPPISVSLLCTLHPHLHRKYLKKKKKTLLCCCCKGCSWLCKGCICIDQMQIALSFFK